MKGKNLKIKIQLVCANSDQLGSIVLENLYMYCSNKVRMDPWGSVRISRGGPSMGYCTL